MDSLRVDSLLFKPFSRQDGDVRCQADADKYEVDPAFLGKLTFLGYQRAFDQSENRILAGPEELQVIAAFQDRQRRGVALSFQPQFLMNAAAAHQIVYDAVIYASFAHSFREANLSFTEGRDGVHLVPDAMVSPAKDRLYLTYSDDYAGPDMAGSTPSPPPSIRFTGMSRRPPSPTGVRPSSPSSREPIRKPWWRISARPNSVPA